ncbi:MAG: hypothetical protein H6Q14_1287 [Bacteroidetes bacterium]|nr:hypothetical protein [Bacteroidota bacterium]
MKINFLLMNRITVVAGFLFSAPYLFSQTQNLEVHNSSVPLQPVAIEIPIQQLQLPVGIYESAVEWQQAEPLNHVIKKNLN